MTTNNNWWNNPANLASFMTWLHREHGFDEHELINMVAKPWQWTREYRLMVEVNNSDWIDMVCPECETTSIVKADSADVRGMDQGGETCSLCRWCGEGWMTVQLPEEVLGEPLRVAG